MIVRTPTTQAWAQAHGSERTRITEAEARTHEQNREQNCFIFGSMPSR